MAQARPMVSSSRAKVVIAADREQRKRLYSVLSVELAQAECAGRSGQAAVPSEHEPLGIPKIGKTVARAAEGAVASSGHPQGQPGPGRLDRPETPARNYAWNAMALAEDEVRHDP